MSTLKVAWDNHYAERDVGGTGVYGASLLREFAYQPELKVEVLNGCQSDERRGGFVTRATRVVQDLFWTQVALPHSLKKRETDLLHVPAFTGPLLSPCPVVITLHDITFLLYPSHFRRWWVTYFKVFMPPAIKSAAAVICVSEHAKSDIVRAYGVAADKVCVVPHGVDHEKFHPGAALDAAWAQQLGLRPNYVLHVGTLSSRKNVPTLLRALARLRSLGKGPCQLVLAGQEVSGLAGAPEIHDTIRQLDLTDSVVFTGRVPEDRLAGLYAGARVLVMPSLYEGFGFPILESMAVGTPVIASNASSLPEVAGNAAILVAPMDDQSFAAAIADINSDPSLAAELRRKGLQRAQQFNWQRAAAETIAVYRRALSR